jgi:hypothetical protein
MQSRAFSAAINPWLGETSKYSRERIVVRRPCAVPGGFEITWRVGDIGLVYPAEIQPATGGLNMYGTLSFCIVLTIRLN